MWSDGLRHANNGRHPGRVDWYCSRLIEPSRLALWRSDVRALVQMVYRSMRASLGPVLLSYLACIAQKPHLDGATLGEGLPMQQVHGTGNTAVRAHCDMRDLFGGTITWFTFEGVLRAACAGAAAAAAGGGGGGGADGSSSGSSTAAVEPRNQREPAAGSSSGSASGDSWPAAQQPQQQPAAHITPSRSSQPTSNTPSSCRAPGAPAARTRRPTAWFAFWSCGVLVPITHGSHTYLNSAEVYHGTPPYALPDGTRVGCCPEEGADERAGVGGTGLGGGDGGGGGSEGGEEGGRKKDEGGPEEGEGLKPLLMGMAFVNKVDVVRQLIYQLEDREVTWGQ